jgi:hypothetical protein
VITKLAGMIENGDPNVSATADLNRQAIFLNLRDPGASLSISFSVSVSDGATFSATSGKQFLQPGGAKVVNDVRAIIGESLPLVPGQLAIVGTPVAGVTVTVKIADTPYSYTVQEGDTLLSTVSRLAEQVNNDPNVMAAVDPQTLLMSIAFRDPANQTDITFTAEISDQTSLLAFTRSAETTGSEFAAVSFAGPVEGLVGLYQVNFVLPTGTPPNPATKLTLSQNLIIFGSISEFDIFSNVVSFPVGSASQ